MRLRRNFPLFVGCLASTLVAAQTKRAMTIVDLIEVPQLMSPQQIYLLSNSGDRPRAASR